jgi:hypothetical protein
MEACPHGMGPDWCYLCHVDSAGVDSRTAWGLDDDDIDLDTWDERRDPMPLELEGYIDFLCTEFDLPFDDRTLTRGEAELLISGFMDEVLSDSQARTLDWLTAKTGTPADRDLTYGQARAAIRRLVALRGLKSA